MKTDVAIIGAGPAGLMLAHLLHQAGIEVIILERYSENHVLSRIRAGILEQTTVGILDRLQINERLHAEGIVHDGVNLSTGDRLIRIDLAELTGKHVVVYGQTEATKDLIDAARSRAIEIVWNADDVSLHAIDSGAPYVTYIKDGTLYRVDAIFIAGCDGFHGVARKTLPTDAAKTFERVYPFGWLGLLADVPPCHPEIVYANHERGFALASMRSKTRSRYYVQVDLNEEIGEWSDERFWNELSARLGPTLDKTLIRGPSLEKSITPLRSFVCEPMQYGRLFLAGDAAHIVPPTGAKGLNLAASDVAYLSDAMIAWFDRNDRQSLANYSSRALSRIWKAERFAWSLSLLLHRFPGDGQFERRMQMAELDYLASSGAAQTAFAENYVGLPL